MHPVVHLVGCGSRPTSDLPDFAAGLRGEGWEPYIVPSPVGRRFLDPLRAVEQSGHAVHWDFEPDAPVELPQAHVVVVAPATFNTVTKLAAGAADTLALAVAAEAIGAGRPVVVVPWANASLKSHPVYAGAMRTLDQWGIHVLPADQAESFPWVAVRERLTLIRASLGTGAGSA
ncbi:flavoprotein [Streptomyces phaeochromogenes]|uniref:flavoprotein n=1 Tax=Streptomyces sp. MBT65 TaxID=1488395 RepID=UPI0019090A22|nr:flavoprotein [Streptomyces sp. MBT65]MBK3575967.1 flavoprotein [Streptomyces sp. MBT65]